MSLSLVLEGWRLTLVRSRRSSSALRAKRRCDDEHHDSSPMPSSPPTGASSSRLSNQTTPSSSQVGQALAGDRGEDDVYFDAMETDDEEL